MNGIIAERLYQCVCVHACTCPVVLSAAINLADVTKLIVRLASPTCIEMGPDTDLPSDLSSLTHAGSSIIGNVKI